MEERIIEFMIEDNDNDKLIDLSLKDFSFQTASESPAPGGGSISAYCGAMGAALATMVANLSANKRGWDDRWQEFSQWAEKGFEFQEKLLLLVDEDTNSFNQIMESFKLPKENKEDINKRNIAIQKATKNAILTPFKVMEIGLLLMDVIKKMAEIGNPNSITDACVAGLCTRTAIRGAFLNVKINCLDYNDKDFINKIEFDGNEILNKAIKYEEDIIEITNKVMNS
jgi:glutamate formiminotransferase/formiminotetrahydrofolate cyclodeaminase|tara:strand:- start:172 stop:849 length:678 start_codon:yes stop_codon:yes gene_type:complete